MLRFTLTLVAVIALGAYHSVSADQDLDSLLGELTFGDSNRLASERSQLLEQSPKADELVPIAPTIPSAPSRLTTVQEPASVLQPEQSIQSLQDSAAMESQPIPQPIQSEVMGEAPINFNQYFQSGGMGDACASGRAAAPCDAQAHCRPHVAPNLPPPSTILQYFRSNDCYSNVWSGFAAERQRRCEECHKHIHGTCDCFSKGHSHCKGGCSVHTASTCDTVPSYR